MTPERWWKNFGIGLEIDVAGTFIYNAIYHLHKLSRLNDSTDSFEILYGLSVGIERLQKAAIILLEHKDGTSPEELEKSLISHNTLELSNRIDDSVTQNLSRVHKELLSLLSKFYKTHRYGRYSLSSGPNIEEEKVQLVGYLQKHLSIDVSESKMYSPINNTDQIRRFLGKVVKKITDGLYQIIRYRAMDLNLYTYELRSGSKARKVFLGERLDFLDEDKIRREMLLYLMNTRDKGGHFDFLRSIDYLEIDPGLTPSYIKALINDLPENHDYVAGEIKEMYQYDINNVGERFKILDLIDDDSLVSGYEYNEE